MVTGCLEMAACIFTIILENKNYQTPTKNTRAWPLGHALVQMGGVPLLIAVLVCVHLVVLLLVFLLLGLVWLIPHLLRLLVVIVIFLLCH